MTQRKQTEVARIKFRLRSLKNHKMHLEAHAKKGCSPDPIHLRCEIDKLASQMALFSKQLQQPLELHGR